MSHSVLTVPDVLQQKCCEVNDASVKFCSEDVTIENGKILLWKNQETKYFWTADNLGRFSLYRYHNGIENSNFYFAYNFRSTAVISDVVFFPSSVDCPGIAVAVSDRAGGERGCYFIAYFSLKTCRLLKCYHVTHPITCLYNVFDGTALEENFKELVNQFHNGWKDMLLVGCRAGHAYLLNLNVSELQHSYKEEINNECFIKKSNEDCSYDDNDASDNENENKKKSTESASDYVLTPVRAKRTVPLTKLFHGNDMFVFRSDEGRTICIEKDRVFVSALHYIEKCKVVLIGFNFGGILSISLATSKISITHMVEGVVKYFAVQEPEEDPRPLLYYWTCIQTLAKGTYVVLMSVNFPKDEANAKNPSEYTYLEPHMLPLMKWQPDNCTEMISFRTLYVDRRKTTPLMALTGLDSSMNLSNNKKMCDELLDSKLDTSLMLMVWQQKSKNGDCVRTHGSLFDLNSFYVKRLSSRVLPDNTVAKQFPFFSRFTSDLQPNGILLLDVVAESVFRFPAPAFLKDSIDQLFYPSTFYITFNQLSNEKFSQYKVQPIQIQLISELTQRVSNYFESPSEISKWIFAIGLANSAPAHNNINEERACMLRVLLHIFLPGVMRLIAASAKNVENLKYIQRWIWKEVEITKTKFDDLSAPLFLDPPMELSPDARGYLHHARAFFRRASLVLEALRAYVEAFDDIDWKNSLSLQYRAARQVEMFSLGIAFGLFYELLPLNGKSLQIHNLCIKNFNEKKDNAKKKGVQLEIQKLINEIIELTPDELIWRGKTAETWFPPIDFSEFLPILLLMEINESAKLNLLGYYCIEFERAAIEFDDYNLNSVHKKLFEKCCSLFMQDDYSLELHNHICKMWNDDKLKSNLDLSLISSNYSLSSTILNNKKENDFKWLPLTTSDEIQHAREEYLKLEYGIHKFNWNVIEKRRFDLIMEAPIEHSNEPDFVVKCREKCAEIRSRFPWIFSKIEPFCPDIINKFRKNLEIENKELRENVVHIATRKRLHNQDQHPIHLNVRHYNEKNAGSSYGKAPFSLQNIKRRRTLRQKADDEFNGILSDDEDCNLILNNFNTDEENEDANFEELPLTIATPAKRQRLMLFSLATPNCSVFQSTSDIYMGQSAPPGDAKRRFTVGFDQRKQENKRNNDLLVENLKRQAVLPRRRLQTQTPFVFNSPVSSAVYKKDIKPKEWERISKVIQTPQSLKKKIDNNGLSRIPIRLQNNSIIPKLPFSKDEQVFESTFTGFLDKSPIRFNEPPQTPASILKSNKNKSRLPSEVRLRFSAIPQTEKIPSRAEKQYEEAKDNSFTTFGALTESSSSPSLLRDISYQDSFSSIVSPLSRRSFNPHLSEPLQPPNFEEQDEIDVSNDWGEDVEEEKKQLEEQSESLNIIETIEVEFKTIAEENIIVEEKTVVQEEIESIVKDKASISIKTLDHLQEEKEDEEDSIAKRVHRSRNSKSPTPEPKYNNEKLQSLNSNNILKICEDEQENETFKRSLRSRKSPTPQPQLKNTNQKFSNRNNSKALIKEQSIELEKETRSRSMTPPLKEQKNLKEFSKSPVSRATKSPTSRATKSPTPRATKSPTPRATKSPTPRATKSPTPRATKSPTPRATKSPTPRATKSPTPRSIKSPTPRNKLSVLNKTKVNIEKIKNNENEDESNSHSEDEIINNWIAANKRKSTRTKSPRKFFDLSKNK